MKTVNELMKRQIAMFGTVVCVALLAGCTIGADPKPGDPAYAPVTAAPLVPVAAASGSIYRNMQPAAVGPGLSLFEDRRARNIGDVITITLSESTTSSKSADTSISKDDEVSIDAGVVLGATPRKGQVTMETATSASRAFDGGASADQSNALRGTITVTVADVMPNGLLEVRGEKWMTLNRGDEFIRIRGYVRPEDVLPDNSIPSTRVADVRITYSGSGELAQANRQGWASRFFSSEFWPF